MSHFTAFEANCAAGALASLLVGAVLSYANSIMGWAVIALFTVLHALGVVP